MYLHQNYKNGTEGSQIIIVINNIIGYGIHCLGTCHDILKVLVCLKIVC
jgi:hypothetical protein